MAITDREVERIADSIGMSARDNASDTEGVTDRDSVGFYMMEVSSARMLCDDLHDTWRQYFEDEPSEEDLQRVRAAVLEPYKDYDADIRSSLMAKINDQWDKFQEEHPDFDVPPKEAAKQVGEATYVHINEIDPMWEPSESQTQSAAVKSDRFDWYEKGYARINGIAPKGLRTARSKASAGLVKGSPDYYEDLGRRREKALAKHENRFPRDLSREELINIGMRRLAASRKSAGVR